MVGSGMCRIGCASPVCGSSVEMRGAATPIVSVASGVLMTIVMSVAVAIPVGFSVAVSISAAPENLGVVAMNWWFGGLLM